MAKFSDALWYIDGHIEKIELESSRKFPPSFKSLMGFNRPELSKHRKRDIKNLSGAKLSQLAMSLKEVIQSMTFAKSNESSAFKIECLKMAHVMEDYSAYLAKTNNKMIYFMRYLLVQLKKMPTSRNYL